MIRRKIEDPLQQHRPRAARSDTKGNDRRQMQRIDMVRLDREEAVADDLGLARPATSWPTAVSSIALTDGRTISGAPRAD
ncbi:hypothetical protein [Bradyrhizobium sp. 2TAF24]|uniref:hypothetical protein n=1 Tax=Bradyrhizobium sp. 2TAF24 TaxID=3233011 RepID=UPI003F8EB643